MTYLFAVDMRMGRYAVEAEIDDGAGTEALARRRTELVLFASWSLSQLSCISLYQSLARSNLIHK